MNIREKFALQHLEFMKTRMRVLNEYDRKFVIARDMDAHFGRLADITERQYNYLKNLYDKYSTIVFLPKEK